MKWVNRTLLVISLTAVSVASSAGILIVSSIGLVGAGVAEVYNQVKK